VDEDYDAALGSLGGGVEVVCSMLGSCQASRGLGMGVFATYANDGR